MEGERTLIGRIDHGCDVLRVFQPPCGRNNHHSYVRAHSCFRWIYRHLYRSDEQWPFTLITKCQSDREKQHREFQPHSDFLVSKSDLPRLLVEVHSKPKQRWPEDLVRMILCGAFVVRMANMFLDRFIKEKNFVLFAMYIWEDGKVTRYSLFQKLGESKVWWTWYITELEG
jgi:hypothetical protein